MDDRRAPVVRKTDPILGPLSDHWRTAAARTGVAVDRAELDMLARQTLETMLAGPIGEVVAGSARLATEVPGGPDQTARRRALLRAVRELLDGLPDDHPVRRRIGA